MTELFSHTKLLTNALILLALASVFSIGSTIGFAQEKKKEEASNESKAEIKTLPPAYNSQMLELAEVLGSLHYLRELCKANEGQIWRDQMQGLLDAEDPSSTRRAQLIAHFNRGFRGYQEIYRECTHVAAEASNRHLKQGIRLATEIPSRFGK